MQTSPTPRLWIALLIVASAAVYTSTAGTALATPDADIQRTTWQLRPTPATAGLDPITIHLDDGELLGDGACNTFHTTYRLRGRSVSFASIWQTLVSCGHDVNRAERSLFDALIGDHRITIEGAAPHRTLTLSSPTGSHVFDELP